MTAGLELPHLPATTIGDVVDDLGALRGRLPRGDGVRYFNHLYLEVTTEVRRAVIAREAADPAFMEALDVAFANAYLAAVVAAQAGPGAAPPAWRPLFEQRFAKRVAPIQFALAGVNAHLNYDLPMQIVATCQARGMGLDDDSPQHRDFERMADVFQRAEAHAKRWMLTGVLRRLDRVLGHVDDRVAIWSLLRARDAAWTNALTLSHLAGAPELAEDFRDALAHTVGAFGRGLLVPSVPGIQRWADLLRPA